MGMDERGTRLEYVMFLLVQTQAELFSDLVVVVGWGERGGWQAYQEYNSTF